MTFTLLHSRRILFLLHHIFTLVRLVRSAPRLYVTDCRSIPPEQWGSKSRLFCLQVFFDVTVAGHEVGRIVIGLFGEVVPLTVANFVALATGEVQLVQF